jgi:hypothetical protein
MALYVVSVNSTGERDRGLRTLLTVKLKVSPASLLYGNMFATTRVSPVGVTIKSHFMFTIPDPTAQLTF